ncbi:MAG TPA: C40 family peptidase [Candidatus Brachybacterium merdigallinarum]|nr:C40 family peptidase [Candidatus Brachybacterium merdigallinarum]
MKKVLALGVGGVMLLGVTVVGASVLDEEGGSAACLPGGAAVTVNVDGLPEEVAGYSGDALRNAAVIAQVGEELGFGRQGQIVALITAMQESDLGRHPSTASPDENGDAGVFQQRQLDGWYGSLEEVNDVSYAATAFYNGVTAETAGDYGSVGGGTGYGHIPGLTDISGWESMTPAEAAQAVQRSGHPNAYASHVDEAEALLAGLADADVTVDSAAASDAGGASDSGGDPCAGPAVEATGDAAEALARGRTLLGTPYEFGGGGKHGPDTGIDCSGFVLFAFGLDNNVIGRTAQAQFDSLASTSVPPDQIQPGDLIFYAKGRTGPVGSPDAISHVAIYSGNGKMIESTRYNGGTEPGVQEVDAQVEDGRGFVDVRRLPSTSEEAA